MTAENIAPIEEPCAWDGEAMADDPRWRFALSDAEIAKLQAVLASRR